MKHVIVGTAGHIDHGKSALVEALTGTDPDRWAEEKRRGITIDLGFAHLDVPGADSGQEVRLGFVDVPGHERFVRNMLAGASGIDLVLLVIAADESIKPQTREHFDICRLLGVERGLTVLTKADLVEPDMVELVRLEAEEFLQGSFLAGAPVVPVSSKTGAGLEQLKRELVRVAAAVPGKDASHIFRLPIDRAFVMKGFGTVVTGTLVAGSVSLEQEVEVFPQRRRLRVRGLQVHGEKVERAVAGQRTAVNLAGVETGELTRGDVLSEPGLLAPAERLDAQVTLLPGARPLKHGARVHFHHGTTETLAEVRLLDRDRLAPGAQAFAHLRLQASTLLVPGDRFILRQFSPVITIGGGRVLSTEPGRRRRNDATLLAHLKTLSEGKRAEVLETLLSHERRGTLDERALSARTGWRPEEVRAELTRLVEAGRLRAVVQAPLTVASRARFEELSKAALAAVEAFHQKEPLLEGIPREELKERVFGRTAEALFEAVLAALVEKEQVETAGDRIRRRGRAVMLSREEAEAKRVLEEAFARAGLKVPTVKEVLGRVAVEPKRAQKILQILVREQVLVKVTEDLFFHRAALGHLRERLAGYKKQKGERIGVPAFKELAGVTRKYAIPLLEYLDRQRVTRRQGDQRVIV